MSSSSSYCCFEPSRAALPALVLALVLLGSCSREPERVPTSESSSKPRVFAANEPLRYFAERIGGERVEVYFPIPAGKDPAYWKPSSEEIGEVQGCDLILLNGATFEKWADGVTLPDSRVLDTSAGFADELIEVPDAITHRHGPEGEHSHAGIAITTWLDFTLAAKQAAAVKDALVRLLPAAADELDASYRALADELAALDEQVRSIVATRPSLPLFASHPVYQYLERRYALNLKSLHWEPDELPDVESWKELDELRASHRAGWMLWEGEPLRETTEKLAGMGIRSIVYDPCGSAPQDGDFLACMGENVGNLARAFRGEGN